MTFSDMTVGLIKAFLETVWFVRDWAMKPVVKMIFLYGLYIAFNDI